MSADFVSGAPAVCPMCSRGSIALWHSYAERPQGETEFKLEGAGAYRRDVYQCVNCKHFVSVNSLPLDELYKHAYVESTYGDAGIAAVYQRIMTLPPEKSDNVARVKRIQAAFAESKKKKHTVLDIGSGLCVFLARMRQFGWECTALDPDAKAAEHARKTVGIEAIKGDFFKVSIQQKFDLVTLNKVLEHVQDPVAMLVRAKKCLGKSGIIYIEVPDGEAASAEGPGREEFFIEHLHVFSWESLRYLAGRAGCEVLQMERCREPSSKYTLFAFLKPSGG